MAELNDKLISYGNLSTFHDNLINDSVTSGNSTWSSEKIASEIQQGGGGGGSATIENVTYSELKVLRDNKQLVPGQQYRITDYVTTTAQANTQSAGHQFDIIVVADSEDKLNENARAIQHSGDTYFANSKLESWELKYCLDNNTNRFAWAQVSGGTGVIYYMKDEWNNECPYDFKNIQFKRKVVNTNGYYELDEQNGTDAWLFTFAANENDIQNDSWSELLDGSLESPYMHITDEGGGTYINNTIKPYIEFYPSSEEPNDAGLQYLNDIVFIGYYSTNPSDEEWAYPYCSFNNTFGYNCHNNTFGHKCYNNIFGNSCNYNTFKKWCNFNTFGNTCEYNTFGNTYENNTFGDNCRNNTFGNGCQSNTFGNNCGYNTFGNNCKYNTFGIGCTNNNFTTNYNTSASNELMFINVLSYSAFGAVPSGIVLNVEYQQIVGKNSQGVFTVKNPLD